ncbi:NUDIX domain-containing protein [Aminobacter aminovorans]|uniref:Mutator mutT protein n=1 Tax=Aminobacter aminovorans TaxID=83263 RepID=A0A380WLD7_AMIAI|nr:NUDIX domain-containing protein [Aminobacter aminovorans]SUU89122.1 mutator mutT protein [Aminobacter aminovorans]
MRMRPSARVLLLDQSGSVLLFKFVHASDALTGSSYWATPGGAVEDGETFEQAALRELQEETGLSVNQLSGEVGRRSFEMQLASGERVWADERFFADGSECDLVYRLERQRTKGRSRSSLVVHRRPRANIRPDISGAPVGPVGSRLVASCEAWRRDRRHYTRMMPSTGRRASVGLGSAALCLLRRTGGLGRQVERHRGLNQRFQRLFVERVAFANVDGAPGVAVEAGVEQT